MKRILCVALLPVLLAGCLGASRDALTRPDQVEAAALAELAPDTPDIVQVPVPANAFKIASQPLPAGANPQVDVEFNNVRLEEILVSVTRGASLNLIYESTGKGELKDARLSLIYKGDLHGFLRMVSKLSGAFFSYEDDALVVKKYETFSFVLPTYPKWVDEVGGGGSSDSSDDSDDSDDDSDLATGIMPNLKQLGATELGYDRLTSTMTFRADYQAYQRISRYLDALGENAALVMMRIVLLNVKTSEEHNYGIDWTKLALGMKDQKGWTTGTGESTTVGASDSFTRGLSVAMGEKGAALIMDGARFTFSGFLNAIERYGSYSVMQNAFVQTLSGMPAVFKVTTATPYIKSVGIASLSQNSGATQATAETEDATTGVELNVLPHYSKSLGTLGVDLNVQVSDVTRFLDLSAGNLGTLQQPERTTKEIKTFIRMTPHQIAVIGGLSRSRGDDAVAGLPGNTYLNKGKSQASEREQLVIVVRPLIVEFVPEAPAVSPRRVCHGVAAGETAAQIGNRYGVAAGVVLGAAGVRDPLRLPAGQTICFDVH